MNPVMPCGLTNVLFNCNISFQVLYSMPWLKANVLKLALSLHLPMLSLSGKYVLYLYSKGLCSTALASECPVFDLPKCNTLHYFELNSIFQPLPTCLADLNPAVILITIFSVYIITYYSVICKETWLYIFHQMFWYVTNSNHPPINPWGTPTAAGLQS